MASVRVVNMSDLFQANEGMIRPEEVRVVEVDDALVDTNSTGFAMPSRLIRRLGLTRAGSRKALNRDGFAIVNAYRAVRLTIQGRECTSEVIELPDDRPVLIGRIVLAMLDFVVDPAGQRLIENQEPPWDDFLELC